ncbi:MAG: GHKL domain-containing protein [Lachnospiraceae bacterium]|nr:GHKL domain-containing protein [Lachnospiraceae bacterium]
MFWGICNLLLSVVEMTGIWVGTFCFMRVNERTIYRRKFWYIVGFFLAVMTMYLMILFADNGWRGLLVQIAVTAVLGALLFHRKMLPLLFDILFSVVVVIGMECGIYMFNIILYHVGYDIFPNPAAMGCVAMVFKLLILFPLMSFMIWWKKTSSEGNLTMRQTMTVLVLPVFSVLFLYSLIRMSQVYIQLYGLWLLLVNFAALLLLNIYFLYLFRYLFRVSKLEQKIRIARIQNELQYRHYEELEQKYRESRKILHDMKNHLQAVEQLYEGENKTAGDHYVKNLYHMINILGEKYYSSNHMLNIILNEKLAHAQSAGIQVTAEVGDADFDDLDDMDITVIFANLLDNAIEAAGETENPWLELKIDTVNDFRVISLRNSRNTSRVCEGRKQGHMGLGLVNVGNALMQYHGSMERSGTEKEYSISIMIPGKE